MDVRESGRECFVGARAPGLGDDGESVVRELADGAEMLGCVNDDLVTLEGGKEVGDDTDLPRAGVRKTKRLGRRSILAARAKRTRLELVG
jgi:hypothetical protein